MPTSPSDAASQEARPRDRSPSATSADPAPPGPTGSRRGRYRQNEEATDGRSEIGPSGAMRARDVARPTAADEEEAERDVVIVRRGWRPPEERTSD